MKLLSYFVFVFLILCGISANAEHQVVTQVGDITYITHYDRFENLEEAKDACYKFTATLGVSDPYCGTGKNSAVTAGNYRKEGTLVWHYLYYYYKKFLISPDFKQCRKEGNPCDVVTGAKTQVETDYLSDNGLLKVIRYYSSDNLEGNYLHIYPFTTQGDTDDGTDDLGPRWKLQYSKRIDGEGELDYRDNPSPKSAEFYTEKEACEEGWKSLRYKYPMLYKTTASYVGGLCKVSNDQGVILDLVVYSTLNQRVDSGSPYPMHVLTRPNGVRIVFREIDGGWKSLYPNTGSLVRENDLWRYTSSTGTDEFYNDNGVLIRTQNTSGQSVLYAYDENGRISTATDSFGNILRYYFDPNGRITTIVTPDGDLEYDYDAEGRLISVAYPDDRQRQYHYEDTRFPNHLTGITDENGNRYATWAYDAKGRAILSEHAGRAERVEFTYNPDGTTTVTDAAGAERTYHFTVQQGQMKVDHIEGDRCTTCSSGDIQAYTYDGNGFVASKTDWNGNTTTYTRDSQGRELTRTEAAGTPQARTITTTWDTTLNKRLTVTEPNQITTYNYDTEGRLLSRQQSPIQ